MYLPKIVCVQNRHKGINGWSASRQVPRRSTASEHVCSLTLAQQAPRSLDANVPSSINKIAAIISLSVNKPVGMKLSWLLALGCLTVLAAAHPVADPTQETLVIARSDDTPQSTEADVSTTEATTDEPVPPIKLTEMEVTSVVALRYTHTAVVARVKNPAKRAQEANFRVLLPETAFISGFIMTLDGKSYKAYVKEKEEAKQIYDDAVSQGLGAAHVQAKARDSNQFVVSVNVEPSSTAVFNLTYEELLVRRNGVYNHAINLHPGALVPKLSVTVHIKEVEKITDLRVPEIRTGNEIDATKDDAQNSKAVIERGHDDREATITFKPDLEEQKRLMDIYAQKSKESQSNTNRWYNNQNEDDKTKNEGVLGQFVVQYDVDRSKDGEVLVNEGYFVHFFAPTSLPPLMKYVVFVLDTSGSMMDRKIIQLREAMQTILSDLKSGDYFSIVEFASSVTVHSLKEADQEPPKRMYYYSDFDKKPTLVAPSPATPENIAKAKVIISRLDAAGGTNIYSALDVAVNLIHKRTEWGKKLDKTNETAPAVTTTEVATTEAINAEDFDVEKMKSLEPIIIFLTDGDPTVGETNPTTIINRLTEKNYGEDKATIFSLAFGEDADRKFLRKLSLRNDGFMRHIYEAADAALQLQDFYRQVSSPLLADVKFVYPANQVKEDSLTKNKFRTFYAGSEVVIAGKLEPDVTEITPQVLGFCGVEDGGVGKKRFEKRPKVPIPAQRQEYLPLERVWSYITIKQLLDQQDASDDHEDKSENTPKKKALALALKYEFVTPLTSLVVVKPNATKAVDAESVDKPSNPSYAYGAPLSINSAQYAVNRFPGSSSAFASIQAAGLPGAPAPLAPAFGSQALSFDSIAQEDAVEDYDYPNQPQKVSGSSGYSGYSGGSGSIALRSQSVPMTAQILSTKSHFRGSVDRITGVPSSGYGAGITSFDSDYTHETAQISVNRADSPLSTPAPAPTALPAAPATTSAAPASTPAAPAHALDSYHLQQFSWVEPLLNATADALVLQVNGTEVLLKLTKDSNVPKASGGDAACEKSVSGSGGVCVYLTRCEGARDITTSLYSNTYCTVDGYAGVCCSAADVDKPVAVA